MKRPTGNITYLPDKDWVLSPIRSEKKQEKEAKGMFVHIKKK